MTNLADKRLQIIESELNFLRHHVQSILREDFDSIDEADMAICSALWSLEEYKLSSTLTGEEVPAGVLLAS